MSKFRSALALVAVSCVFVAVARAFPDDGAPPPAPGSAEESVKPVREAFAAVQESTKAFQTAGRDMEKRKAAGDAYSKARDAFANLFVGANWDAFDVEKDKELLTTGYSAAGGKAWSIDGDMKTARRVYEAFSKSFPKQAEHLGYDLTDIDVATGDFAKAKETLAKRAAEGDMQTKVAAGAQLGDVLAAEGDLAGAQKAWEAAVAAVPADADAKKDRGALGMKASVEARLALVGKPAPDVDSKTWVGGDAKPLSALKGNVVVVDFWATWCIWCRKAMPELSRLYDARKKDGLVVLGVTHVFPSGFMPKAGTNDPMHDGESMKVDADKYVAHLEQFKTNLAIRYPFVVATDEEPKAFHLAGWPTLAVIGRDGTVAFYAVGTDPAGDALIRATVERLLKTPAAK